MSAAVADGQPTAIGSLRVASPGGPVATRDPALCAAQSSVPAGQRPQIRPYAPWSNGERQTVCVCDRGGHGVRMPPSKQIVAWSACFQSEPKTAILIAYTEQSLPQWLQIPGMRQGPGRWRRMLAIRVAHQPKLPPSCGQPCSVRRSASTCPESGHRLRDRQKSRSQPGERRR
jgi:hypothetical protein